VVIERHMRAYTRLSAPAVEDGGIFPTKASVTNDVARWTVSRHRRGVAVYR